MLACPVSTVSLAELTNTTPRVCPPPCRLMEGLQRAPRGPRSPREAVEGEVGFHLGLVIIRVFFAKSQFLTHVVLRIISRWSSLEVSFKNPVWEKPERKKNCQPHITIREGFGNVDIYLLCYFPNVSYHDDITHEMGREKKKSVFSKTPFSCPYFGMALLRRCYGILISDLWSSVCQRFL